jgi:hypothetical protein
MDRLYPPAVLQVVHGGSQAVSEEEALKKLYVIERMNSTQKPTFLVDLQQKVGELVLIVDAK